MTNMTREDMQDYAKLMRTEITDVFDELCFRYDKVHDEQRQVIYGLEKDREMWKAAAQLHNGTYEQQAHTIQRLRKALEFYAHPHSYGINGGSSQKIMADHGKQAQRVLEETK